MLNATQRLENLQADNFEKTLGGYEKAAFIV